MNWFRKVIEDCCTDLNQWGLIDSAIEATLIEYSEKLTIRHEMKE